MFFTQRQNPATTAKWLHARASLLELNSKFRQVSRSIELLFAQPIKLTCCVPRPVNCSWRFAAKRATLAFAIVERDALGDKGSDSSTGSPSLRTRILTSVSASAAPRRYCPVTRSGLRQPLVSDVLTLGLRSICNSGTSLNVFIDGKYFLGIAIALVCHERSAK